MDFLPKEGRLQKKLSAKQNCVVPMSEGIQGIEVTQLDNGQIAEDDTYIAAEKEKKLAALRERYGEIDESQIEWVMIKKKALHLLMMRQPPKN